LISSGLVLELFYLHFVDIGEVCDLHSLGVVNGHLFAHLSLGRFDLVEKFLLLSSS